MGYQLNWIRQRHAFLAEHAAIFDARGWEHLNTPEIDFCDSPGLLWVFGEKGRVHVYVDTGPEGPLTASDIERIALVRRLFPETELVAVNTWDSAVRGKYDPKRDAWQWWGPVPGSLPQRGQSFP